MPSVTRSQAAHTSFHSCNVIHQLPNKSHEKDRHTCFVGTPHGLVRSRGGKDIDGRSRTYKVLPPHGEDCPKIERRPMEAKIFKACAALVYDEENERHGTEKI